MARVCVRARAVGVAEQSLELADGASSIACVEALSAQHPQLVRLLPRCALAINGNYVQESVQLADGDEVAVLPPMSGG